MTSASVMPAMKPAAIRRPSVSLPCCTAHITRKHQTTLFTGLTLATTRDA